MPAIADPQLDSPLMRRHAAALKVLRYASTAEERMALLLAVVCPSDALLEQIDARDREEE